MSEQGKIFFRILRGASDGNIPFDGMRSLLLSIGFQERIRGSHHIFTKEGVEEILNCGPEMVARQNLIRSSRSGK